jgi:MFS family permease
MNNLQSLARKITGVLFVQHSLASAATVAAATVNSIVGNELSHQAGWAGAPTAVYLLGGALAAFGWGYVSDAMGRRGGLVVGLIIGSVGSAIAFLAVVNLSFAVFLTGLVLMGVAAAAVQLGRFAAAEVNLPENRGRAISNVVFGGTIGSVAGPFLAGPAGSIAEPLAGNNLAGAYLAGLFLFAVAALIVFLGLVPDPREIGRQVAKQFPETVAGSGVARSVPVIFRQPAAQVAVLSMVLSQMVMWLLLAITSLHMHDQHHDLGDISLVISSHSIGMYAFSMVSGRLTDRLGRGPVILFGSGMLFFSCIAVTLSPNVWPLGIGLFLLGLGWNFCYVAGSALLSDQLSPVERARTQGVNDLLVGLAAAAGSLGSGAIFAALGFDMVGYISAAFSVVLFAAVLIWRQGRMPSAQIATR